VSLPFGPVSPVAGFLQASCYFCHPPESLKAPPWKSLVDFILSWSTCQLLMVGFCTLYTGRLSNHHHHHRLFFKVAEAATPPQGPLYCTNATVVPSILIPFAHWWNVIGNIGRISLSRGFVLKTLLHILF